MTLQVRAITAEQHDAWIATRPYVSFLQVPQWGAVKVGWRSESLGWFDGSRLVGAGLILYRGVPRLPQRSLAYLPEGPDLAWASDRPIEHWLDPLIQHCRHRGAFTIKMGPPVVRRQWSAETVKAAVTKCEAGSGPRRLSDVPPDVTDAAGERLIGALQAAGWKQSGSGGFGDVQPRFVFQLPLADRSVDDLLTGLNQLWRRNIRRAQSADVTVRLGDVNDLADFHHIYLETADRDNFTPRGLAYFVRMWDVLSAAPHVTPRLFLAERSGHLAAATLMIQVGNRAWYSYGASTTADRDARPSNAAQWAMILAAHEAGCDVYDLRGIVDSVDPSDPLFGLIQFKLGTGGRAIEYIGEWDYTVRPAWARAYALYQRRSQGGHG